MTDEIRAVLYSPRQNQFHIETIDEVAVNVLETVKDYLDAEDKANYMGADFMLIGLCLEDRTEEIIAAFKQAVGLE